MKRRPVTHGGIFTDAEFAAEYARKHWKMADGLGRAWGRKLRKRGFKNGTILDVGCGPGATNLRLSSLFPEVQLVGIDLSEPLLGLARAEARKRGAEDRATFRRADVHKLPFEDDAFDVVLNANMAHLVDDPEGMLDEMERVLAPGGHLFMVDLRRSFLGLLEPEIRSALSAPEARALIRRSRLRDGVFSAGPLFWRFEIAPPHSASFPSRSL